MPRYFFHVVSTTGTVHDPEGSELADLDAALDEAIENARDAMSRSISRGHDVSRRDAIRICDEGGLVLRVVPYTDAILSDGD
ncbi:hypothetical protein ASG43_00065 [Aureimonas sp. Leaf454]|nr:hypothetical protein ASG43_00065 [Aureimonas sp. Leaf454]